MKTSEKRPDGHVNFWPVADKNAFVTLLTATMAKTAQGLSDGVGPREEARLQSRVWTLQCTVEGSPGFPSDALTW